MLKLYNKKINLYFSYLCIILALIAGERLLGIGPDFRNYEEIFSSTTISVEPAFRLFRIMSIQFGGANFAFLFFNIISLSFIYKAFKRYSPYPFVSFVFYSLTFFFLHEYTQIRAAVAIGIFFLSLEDIKNKDFKQYLVKTIMATCFHYSSIIMIVLYLFCQINKKSLYLFLPLFIFAIDLFLIYGLKQNISLLCANYLKTLSNSSVEYFVNKIAYQGEIISLFNKQYLSYMGILIAMYFICIKKTCNEKEFVIFKILSFTLCCWYFLLLSGLTVIIYRIPEFYAPVIVIVLPMLIKRFKEKELPALFSILYILMHFKMFLTQLDIVLG